MNTIEPVKVDTDILILGGGHTNDSRLPANNQLSTNALGRLAEGIRIHRELPGSKIITSAYYALQDTKTPFKIFIVAVITNIIFSYTLMHPLKHGGIALANTISSGTNFILLFIFLRNKIGRVDARKIISSFAKALFASLIMGFVGYFILRGTMWTESGNVLKKSGYLMSTIILCVG